MPLHSFLNEAKGYAPVNGLQLYYELHGQGEPLLLIHGGGSTLDTSFGRILPLLAERHQVIAVELQAHGRTADIDRELSFEQDADDVAALLDYLSLDRASVFGFSNGAQTAMQMGIRHPHKINKLVIASAMFTRAGTFPEFWKFMESASLDNMPLGLQEAFRAVAPKPEELINMHDKDARRMQQFKDFDLDQIAGVQAPVLLIAGDQDIVRPEHMIEIYRLLPHARLFIVPGGHGDYIGELTVAREHSRLPALVVEVIHEFLSDSLKGDPSVKHNNLVQG